ncbi:MAG: hypothetical protein ACFE9C_15065 [Candidatus Hodarchaeota archaeon]
MNEKNNNNHYLSLKALLSESLLRDLILFIFLFLLSLAQGWENILLLLFPLIMFTFSLFFRILSSNKTKTEFNNSFIVYNPLGSERKHANRLFYCTVFQLILIFWLGGESLYNPHIVYSYFLFFLIFLIFLYTFGFFWIFIDLWKNTKIEIITDLNEVKTTHPQSNDLTNIISYLKMNNFKMMVYVTFTVFFVLNILNIITFFLMNNGNLGIQLLLPGSQIMLISYFFVGCLIISPILTSIFLIMNYRNINNIDKEKLDKILEPLPRNIQIKIITNLKALNNRIKEQLKRD